MDQRVIAAPFEHGGEFGALARQFGERAVQNDIDDAPANAGGIAAALAQDKIERHRHVTRSVQLVIHRDGVPASLFLPDNFEGFTTIAIEPGGEGGDAHLGEALDQTLTLIVVERVPGPAHRDLGHDLEIKAFPQGRGQSFMPSFKTEDIGGLHDFQQRRI